MNKLFGCFIILGVGIAGGGCDSPQQYRHLIGKWEIVKIEASGERLVLDEVLDSPDFHFSSRGTFRQGENTNGISGSWKIIGERLQMVQQGMKDLNGRVITQPLHQEWGLTLSAEWMIWRGTARNQSQHIKITLHKVPAPD